jgi:hypothetical protein
MIGVVRLASKIFCGRAREPIPPTTRQRGRMENEPPLKPQTLLTQFYND